MREPGSTRCSCRTSVPAVGGARNPPFLHGAHSPAKSKADGVPGSHSQAASPQYSSSCTPSRLFYPFQCFKTVKDAPFTNHFQKRPWMLPSPRRPPRWLDDISCRRRLPPPAVCTTDRCLEYRIFQQTSVLSRLKSRSSTERPETDRHRRRLWFRPGSRRLCPSESKLSLWFSVVHRLRIRSLTCKPLGRKRCEKNPFMLWRLISKQTLRSAAETLRAEMTSRKQRTPPVSSGCASPGWGLPPAEAPIRTSRRCPLRDKGVGSDAGRCSESPGGAPARCHLSRDQGRPVRCTCWKPELTLLSKALQKGIP